jgi:predicted Fe-S protein YdhL (DUF1289 family)
MSSTLIPSPCIDVCRMDPHSGWCEGCLRTIDEIAAWSTLSEGAKRSVWKQLGARRVQLQPQPRTAPPDEPIASA